jgi:hypothetical protein
VIVLAGAVFRKLCEFLVRNVLHIVQDDFPDGTLVRFALFQLTRVRFVRDYFNRLILFQRPPYEPLYGNSFIGANSVVLCACCMGFADTYPIAALMLDQRP